MSKTSTPPTARASQQVIGEPVALKQPLVKHIYTADPSAHVFGGRIYVYPSHDVDIDAKLDPSGDHFQMVDYHVLSMDDLQSPVIDHGCALHIDDVPWASKQMWAPDAAERDGKYFFYFPAKDHDDIFRIGVATSASPTGPFIAQPEPIQGTYSIDPCVFVDDDGEAYLYFGGLWGGQLQCWQSGRFERDAKEPGGDARALGPRVARLRSDMLELDEPVSEIVLEDETGAPLRASDNARRYFEGPWMHKYRGTYYLSYSTGDTHYLVYATGTSPRGPFRYQGRILNPVVGWTTHHSIIEFQGKWYLFYHDSTLSGGVTHKRCVKVMELQYDDEGRILTLDP